MAFAVSAITGNFSNPGIFPDLPCGLIAVQFRHHDIHQYHFNVGMFLQQPDADLPVLCVMQRRPSSSNALEKRINIPHIVVDDEDLSVLQDFVGPVELPDDLLFLIRQIRLCTMEEEIDLIEKPFL